MLDAGRVVTVVHVNAEKAPSVGRQHMSAANWWRTRKGFFSELYFAKWYLLPGYQRDIR